jgi:hypothetical protein
LLLRRIALDVEDDLLTGFQILRTHFLLQHRLDLGVIDVATMARLIWRIHTIWKVIAYPRERREQVLAAYRDLFCRDEGFEHIGRYVTGLIGGSGTQGGSGQTPLPPRQWGWRAYVVSTIQGRKDLLEPQ